MNDQRFESDYVPVLPLKELVVFPGAVTPLFVVRELSMAALEAALAKDKRVLLACQINPLIDDPGKDDLYTVGTVAEILQVLRAPDGTVKVLVEGAYPARAIEVSMREGYLSAFVVVNHVSDSESKTLKAHMRTTLRLFDAFAELSEKIPPDLFATIKGTSDPLRFLYAVSHYSTLKVEEKQEVLEANNLEEKFHLLNGYLEAENQILELESQIAGKVKDQIGKSQREYYLSEQLKVIERELGLGADEDPDLRELATAIDTCGMSDEAREKAEKELGRLARMAPMSPEAVVTRTYIEWLTEVPWHNVSAEEIDLTTARRILNADHYGLDKIKQRIIEHLAVVKLAGQGKGQILCFVGPPGVGKTSLGRSIAACMGRDFVRISLGGIRDEAEIRGHRRTYVGAMPGKIIQSMKRAGTVNPVFLLDEIDKMSSDFRGDPASALLEVLDPEQNKTFNDHYLEVDYDLSSVMFLTTANTTEGIPHPLLDRMELIRLPGYTEDEKFHIASRHLLPRQRKQHGLKTSQVKLPKTSLMKIITAYTREAGVRELERTLATVCRKVAVEFVEKGTVAAGPIAPERVRELLGPEKYRDNMLERKPEVGTAVGLAWTEAGGELLPVEATLIKGKGALLLTGKLGEVMQESAKTALSYVRSHAGELGIDPDAVSTIDIHIHVPEGAIPKDGPSAGITMATALASALAAVPVRQDIAMTGEVTLRGRVLKIGGLKEKALAAHRRRIRDIIIPKENLDDIEEISVEVRRALRFHPVEWLSEVFALALTTDQGKAKKKPAPPSTKKRGRKAATRNRPSANA
ncbi:MAG: ATP-dependent Lon protease [Candidatus Sumerlaeota bacterium]|nr:ATP-dependent Lon protease [Candidatus Sumerlaeota bacterium]